MSSRHQEHLDYLSTLTEEPLPKAVSCLPEADLAALREFTDNIIARESAALDKYLSSSATGMKFVPGVVLGNFAPNFMAPNLAAHAIKFIPISKVVSMSASIPATYLAEVFMLLDSVRQTQLLARLRPATVARVSGHIYSEHPAKFLDIAAQLADPALTTWLTPIELSRIDDSQLCDPRKATLARLLAQS